MKNYLEQAKKVVSNLTIHEKAMLCTGDTYWATASIAHQGVDCCVMSDGPHGIRKVKGKDHLGQTISEPATCFPTASALGSTWNKELLREIGVALGTECQAVGVDILLGPGVNMKRSPLGGRNFEYFSEDPVHTGELGAAMVQGIQSCGVGACVKHFACNNSEYKRMTMDSKVDERTLREIYLRAFEIIVEKANPVAMMGAYNKINGEYACENKTLITDILRKEWGFEGILLSDWLAVNDIVASIQAGLNLEMPANKASIQEIEEAVASGRLAEEKLDESVGTLIAVLLKLQNARKRNQTVDWERHANLALKAAEESCVLLKNEKDILPISLTKYHKIAVIGRFAKFPRYQGGGSSNVSTTHVECAYEHIEKFVADSSRISYSDGYFQDGTTDETLLEQAKVDALHADITLIFAGLPDSYESEGYDRENIDMPQGHTQLIEEVAKVCSKTVVVLNNGSPVSMDWSEKVQAILESWLGGQSGGQACANILLGLAEPSGRLCETFPKSLQQSAVTFNFPGEEGQVLYGERMFMGYRYYDYKGVKPLYPFGYGLSYTSFRYEDMEVSKQEIDDTETLTVKIKVSNIGARAGKEVVQLYLHDRQTERIRPPKQLIAFEKIRLNAGQTGTISFTLRKRDFACYDSVYKVWRVQSGTFELLAGSSSAEIKLAKEIVVQATDRLLPTLSKHSMLQDWLDHPQGRELAEKMLETYAGFGMGQNKKTFADLAKFVQHIMLEMPMSRLVSASNGSFTSEQLDTMLASL